jgi:hypothetical protein
MRLLLLVLAAVLATGCASFAPPKPWERGDLAKPSMQIDPDRLQTKIDQHVYASREAATGGYGAGGGGCGCN